MIKNEWVEDRIIQGSDEARDRIRSHAHLATAAHDVCHGLAGRFLRAGYEGKSDTLGEDLL